MHSSQICITHLCLQFNKPPLKPITISVFRAKISNQHNTKKRKGFNKKIIEI